MIKTPFLFPNNALFIKNYPFARWLVFSISAHGGVILSFIFIVRHLYLSPQPILPQTFELVKISISNNPKAVTNSSPSILQKTKTVPLTPKPIEFSQSKNSVIQPKENPVEAQATSEEDADSISDGVVEKSIDREGDISGLPTQSQTISEVGEDAVDGKLIALYAPKINYPERARALEIEGTLEVVLGVDTEGSVYNIDVIKSPHAIITSEAKKVFSRWKFKPPKHNGQLVKVRAKQTVEFKLNG